MAFGKISKQDLIDAGLNPDDLAALKANGVTKADLEAIKTANEVNKTTLESLQNSITELSNVLKAKPTVTPTNISGDNKTLTPEEIRAQNYEEFTSDPIGYIQKTVGGSSAFAAVEAKKIARQYAFDNAKASLPGFRNDALRAEIEEEWKKYTAEGMVRSNADPVDLIKKVHDMVMGAHHDDIVRDSAKKEGRFNLVHSGGGGGSSNFNNNRNTTDNTTKKPEELLTAAELESAKQFGMTAQEWLDSKKAVDNETGIYSRSGAAIQ